MKGARKLQPPSEEVIQTAVKTWPTIPAGCSVDFAVLRSGATVALEVNDGHSLGSYGLDPRTYFRLLAARWEELFSGQASRLPDNPHLIKLPASLPVDPVGV